MKNDASTPTLRAAQLHSVERIMTELSPAVRRAWEAIEAEVAERRDNNKAR